MAAMVAGAGRAVNQGRGEVGLAPMEPTGAPWRPHTPAIQSRDCLLNMGRERDRATLKEKGRCSGLA